MRLPPGAVLLDPDEAAYVAGALEEFAQLMAERRDDRGNPAPSQPSARLVSLTAKLRRTAGSLVVTDSGADHEQSAKPPAQPPERTASVRARQRNSVHSGRHVGAASMGTGQVARCLGITANACRDLARRGRLPARHTGTRWQFDAAAVVALAERRAAQRDR